MIRQLILTREEYGNGICLSFVVIDNYIGYFGKKKSYDY